MMRWIGRPWAKTITFDAIMYGAVLLVILLVAGVWRVLGL